MVALLNAKRLEIHGDKAVLVIFFLPTICSPNHFRLLDEKRHQPWRC
jgi:hypothetical protein